MPSDPSTAFAEEVSRLIAITVTAIFPVVIIFYPIALWISSKEIVTLHLFFWFFMLLSYSKSKERKV